MTTRRNFLFGSFVLALSTMAASAAEQSAQQFLESIYARYKGKGAKGVDYAKGGKANRRYFTPSLAELIDADFKAAKKRGDVPELDGDPFVDAQDWDIAAFDIAAQEAAPGKATGIVKFKNLDKDQTITVDLVRTKAGWRVDDLRGQQGSLRAMFKKK